uniref:Uncharacterized protein n=1 Tax=Glossina pallidipes TaxID=7398 RepID=A0A1A9ZA24_GLOPL
MVKNLRNPPMGSYAATVKNSMIITSTLSFSSKKSLLPLSHSSLHFNQVIDLSSKTTVEPQPIDLPSMATINLQGELAINSTSRNASLLTGRRELISVPLGKSIFISKLASGTDIDDTIAHILIKIATLNPNRFSPVLDKSIWSKYVLVKERRGRNPVKNATVENDNVVRSNTIELAKDIVLSDNAQAAKT